MNKLLRQVVKRLKPKPLTYEQYIKSDRWKHKRAQRLHIDGYECRLCGSPDQLEVHHKPAAYSRLGRENVRNDLTTLCRDCHRNYHKTHLNETDYYERYFPDLI